MTLVAGIPLGHRWTCMDCQRQYETPRFLTPPGAEETGEGTCESCAKPFSNDEPLLCRLPAGQHCSSGIHWRDDGGAGSAYERCPRRGRDPHLVTFSDLDPTLQPEAHQATLGWVQQGGLLVLLGVPGAGKTMLLRAARHALAGRAVVYWRAQDVSRVCRDLDCQVQDLRHGAQVDYELAASADALILDDLGRETPDRDRVGKIIGSLIEERQVARTAAASNLTPAEIEGTYGAAFASRLLGGAVVPRLVPLDLRRGRPPAARAGGLGSTTDGRAVSHPAESR